MRLRFILGILASATFMLASCDDTTEHIGSSLIDDMDKLKIETDTFSVTSRTIIADSVLSRNTTGYIGKVKDPQTGAYITGSFMTQFHIMDNYEYPEKDSIVSKNSAGEIIADSCDIVLFTDGHFGDSLAAMKLTAYEMEKPMEENDVYYSNFDPQKKGYVRADGIHVNKAYSLYDLSIDEATRNSSSFTPNIRVKLNGKYTDKEGKTYNNFGSYIMSKYYSDPSNFKDTYSFIHKVVPGFFFKYKSGLGSMGYITASRLIVYFRYRDKVTESVVDSSTKQSKDTTYVKTLNGMSSFAGTEEVLQTTTFDSDKGKAEQLAADNTCTYIKSPAGLFTEVTLPVDEIVYSHESDSINTAKIVMTKINDKSLSDYGFSVPQTLLMIPKSEMYSFFEQNKVADYKTSFLATYNSTYNTYTFGNISNLIKHIHKTADKSKEDWDKVVLIPVTVTYDQSSSTTTITKVSHDMSLSSTRLVGGSANPYGAIKISVVYSKFSNK